MNFPLDDVMKKKKGKGGKHLKVATNVRVTRYELDRARHISDKLQMKLSDYFNMVLHDTNDFYEGVNKWSTDSSPRAAHY